MEDRTFGPDFSQEPPSVDPVPRRRRRPRVFVRDRAQVSRRTEEVHGAIYPCYLSDDGIQLILCIRQVRGVVCRQREYDRPAKKLAWTARP